MKRLFIIALVMLMAAGSKAQLRSSGPVPSDLKMNVMELYESDVQRATRYAGGKVRNKQNLMEAAYRINKMMAGGRIVYGDPISQMAGRIADTLLKDQPELRSELRFYTVKSPEVNAFATGQGMIFVNVGLMAQVENEAQLAFVISHEIIHYYHSHTMEELVGSNDGRRDSDREREDMDQFMLRHNRSREMENEADSLGIAMFYLRSPYAKNVVDGVFDVLQYSTLPFDDVPFDTTYFNTSYYQLNGCWLDTVATITSRDDYDDSRSTHPNILSRRRRMAQALDGYYGGDEFVVTTRDEFMALRDMARMECIRQELISGEYSRAFYNAWLVDREQRAKGSPSELTAEYLAQSLYGVAMFKNHNGTNSVAGDYNKVEGESQQVYYAFRRMTGEQVTLAALHRIWQLHLQYPQNEAFMAMCADLMDELHNIHRLPLGTFLATPPSGEKADTIAEQQDNSHLSKYERIRQKRQSQTQNGAFAYALTDLQMSDSTFNEMLKRHFAGNSLPSTEDSTVADGGVFIYNSSYWVVDDHNERLKVEKSHRGEQNLAEMIVGTGRRFGRETVDFSDRGLHQMETAEQYNDFVVLNEWVNEFWQNKGQFALRRLTQPDMDSLRERYGANTVSINALLNVENIAANSEHMAAAILLVPLIPIIAFDAVANTERTALMALVIDAERGKILSRQSYDVDIADNQTLVGSMVYDSYSRAFKGKATTGIKGLRMALMGGVQMGMPGFFPISKVVTFTPWASAEFAFDSKNTLSVGWSHIGAYDQYNTEVREVPIYNTSGYYIGNTEQTFTDLDYSKAMTTWSLTYRRYADGFAPMGPNFGLGAHMVHFTNPSDGTSGGNSFGLHVSAGYNYVFFDRLVLNLEARYGYTVGLITPSLNEFEKEYMYKVDALLHNLIQLRVGIGILPF